jgi:formylmethanofuran:tetrahydromethanopterin formyltransferase
MTISKKAENLIREHPNETNEIYNNGIREGQKHEKPSNDTIKLIKAMEDKFEKLKDELLEKIGRIELSLEKTVREIFDRVDDRYARKDKVDKLGCRIDDIEKQRESRSYEWLKFAITAVVSGVIGVVLANLYK